MTSSPAAAAVLHNAGPGAVPAPARPSGGATDGVTDAFAALMECIAEDTGADAAPTGGLPVTAAAAPPDAALEPGNTDTAAAAACAEALLLLAPAPMTAPTVPTMPLPTLANPTLSNPPAPRLSTLPAPPPAAPATLPRPTLPAAVTDRSPGGSAALDATRTSAGLPGTRLDLPAGPESAQAGQSRPAPAIADSAPPDAVNGPTAAHPPDGFGALPAQPKLSRLATADEPAPAAPSASLDTATLLLAHPPAPAPQAAASAPAPAAVHHAALSSRPLDTPFAGDVAAEVRVMVDAGSQRAELHLNPPDLGPIRIELSLSAQTADIRFAAAHSMTREGLAQAIPELRQMLASQGLSLGHADVSSGQQGQSFAQSQQQARTVAQGSPGMIAGPEPSGSRWAPGARLLRPGRGMLDLYA